MSRAAPWFVSAPEPMTTEPMPHVLLDRSARSDADDRADADLHELVDDDAHRGRAHPARRAHDRGPAGQRGGEGVEAPVARQHAHRAEVLGGDALRSRRVAAEQGDRRAVVEVVGPEPEVVQRAPAVTLGAGATRTGTGSRTSSARPWWRSGRSPPPTGWRCSPATSRRDRGHLRSACRRRCAA